MLTPFMENPRKSSVPVQEQFDLYDGCPAETLPLPEPNSTTQSALVLQFIASRGARGATDSEVEDALGFKRVSTRRHELVQQGLVVYAGGRRLTSSGRAARVWILNKTART